MIHSAQYKYADDEYVHDENLYLINRIRAKVAHFEDELPKLREITTILELALWKLRMNENIPQEEVSHCQKKMKTDELNIRRQCRITCGADVVIRHVLPYLISTEDEESV